MRMHMLVEFKHFLGAKNATFLEWKRCTVQ